MSLDYGLKAQQRSRMRMSCLPLSLLFTIRLQLCLPQTTLTGQYLTYTHTYIPSRYIPFRVSASVVQLVRTSSIMRVVMSSSPKWKFSYFPQHLWLLLSDYRGMAKWFGAHYNPEVLFCSAVKCKKGPQVLTSPLNQRRNYYFYFRPSPIIALLDTLYKHSTFASRSVIYFTRSFLTFFVVFPRAYLGFLEPCHFKNWN